MTRILIVDEDTDVLRLLRIKLTQAGYEISRARDGQEALALAAQDHPDLAVMELTLPDMDGRQLISRLRTSAQPPLVLALSGKTSDDDIAAALSAGAVDFIAKPFSPQGLLERIRVNRVRAGLAERAGRDG